MASRSVARWAPGILFALVALVHLHQNQTANLNPWLGGGFGMFSTSDQPWPHSLSIEAEDANGKRYLVDWTPPWSRPAKFHEREALYAQPNKKGLSMAASYALEARHVGRANSIRQLLDNLRTAGSLDRVSMRESADVLSRTEIVRAESDASPSGLAIVRATARAWRLRFDTRTARFITEPNGEAGEASRQP